MVCQELDEVVRVLDPGKEPIPLVCTVNGKPGGFPDVFLVERRIEDSPEEVVAALTNGIVLYRRDQLNSVARAIEFLDDVVLECRLELGVDLPKKGLVLRTGKGSEVSSLNSQKDTHLLSVAARSST